MTAFKYDRFRWAVDNILVKDLLFIGISGSHTYGWNREDSDLDIREVWFPDIAQILSPFYKPRTKTEYRFDNTDFVSYPANIYIRLLDKGNGNMLENLFQHKVYENKKLVDELKDITLKNLHTGFLKHYAGYSLNMKKDFTNESRLKKVGIVKLILTRYRVLLSGILLNTYKEVIYNLNEQHKKFMTDHCLPLLEKYKNNEEISGKLIKSAINETDRLDKILKEDHIDKPNLIPAEQSPSPSLNRWFVNYYEGR